MRSVFVATRPSRLCGIFFECRSARIFSALSAAHEITMRDCDSLKKTSVVLTGLRPVSERPTGPWLHHETSIHAPKGPAGLKHDSASVTASPPPDQPTPLFTSPARPN